MTAPLLEVRAIAKRFAARRGTGRGSAVQALDGVSLTIQKGETLGLVGESGCGKSTLGRVIVGLESADAGRVVFDGRELPHGRREPALRRRLQVVFQDPYGALDPRRSVGASIAEGIEIHRLLPKEAVAARVAELMAEVGLDPASAGRHPHEFSGGQRQRVGIARALAVDPDLLVLDEPVSALDVSVQAQVLNLLADLQAARGLAYLFIAHDLAVVRQLASRIAVMYLGRIVECGPAEVITAAPRHPYTRALRSAVPVPVPGAAAQRILLAGEPPPMGQPVPGCAFASRCYHPLRDARCLAERPVHRTVGPSEVACHHAEET